VSNIKIFEDKKIRALWDEEKEDWWFSVVDVCSIFSESKTPRNYWSDLKRKLKDEGSELHEDVVQLKLESSDGKKYNTDVLDTKGILRLVQSIPSKKAEPFKLWLAQVGSERLEEIVDPEKAILRGVDFYRKKGYSEGWINQRIQTIEMRKELTDEWKERGANNPKDYAILTNEMTKAWSGMNVKEYKQYKGLKKENLRDNMTNVELVMNMLSEVTTTAISKKEKPETFEENKEVAIKGGEFAGDTKDRFEKLTGSRVVSSLNSSNKKLLEKKINVIEKEKVEN